MQLAYILGPDDIEPLAKEVAAAIMKEIAKIQAQQDVLTKEGAAKYFKVSITTINKRIGSKAIPPHLVHKNGGTTYFLASELEAFLKKS